MRDLFFYPLAFLVIASIIAIAILPGLDRMAESHENILANGFELSGADLSKLTAAPTTFAEFDTDETGVVVSARIYGNMPRDMAPASAGVFGTLSASYLRVFAGQKLEIRVRARKNPGSKIEHFDLGFFTPGGGSSGWKKYSLTQSYQDFSFIYSAPAQLSDSRVSYVGVWPGDEGDSQPMDVQLLSVKTVQP
jgi:hypothetical protein